MFWFAFACYVAATVLYAYQFFLRRQKVGWWARFATGAGFILQTLSVGVNSVANDGTPLTGANQLVLASWALVLLYFVMEHLLRIRAYGAFLVPVAVVAMAVAQFVGGGGEGSLVPPDATIANQLNSWGVGFHVALVVFANAGFAVGSVSAMLYLFQEQQLKSHRTSVVGRRLPSLAMLQTVSRRAVALAFPVYTAGLSLGVIRAVQVDVGGWWMDPRIMMSGIVLLTYGVYLTFVYRHEVSGRTTAWMAVVGFVFVVVLAVIARTLPVGFHVFGQL
jgi:ABC-type transport system involved in cytochrome c biogenesis permease subunit